MSVEWQGIEEEVRVAILCMSGRADAVPLRRLARRSVAHGLRTASPVVELGSRRVGVMAMAERIEEGQEDV